MFFKIYFQIPFAVLEKTFSKLKNRFVEYKVCPELFSALAVLDFIDYIYINKNFVWAKSKFSKDKLLISVDHPNTEFFVLT